MRGRSCEVGHAWSVMRGRADFLQDASRYVADTAVSLKNPSAANAPKPDARAARRNGAGLFAPVQSIPGVGSRLAGALAQLLGRSDARRLDLLWHVPYAAIRRELAGDLGNVREGERVTLRVRVLLHAPPARSRQPYRVRCWAHDRFLHLIFFRARESYLLDVLPADAERIVSGMLTRFGPEWQIIHPELVTTPEAFAQSPRLEPVYPLTRGLGQRQLGRLIARALDDLPELPEWQDPAWLHQQQWPDFASALEHVHRPADAADVAPGSAARRRLAFDELLANQLALASVRSRETKVRGRSLTCRGDLRRRILAALPFALTHSQKRALAEIDADMARPARMLRLLQGDVGSGKTLVALLAMLTALEAGAQAALMAPTELLARQHARTLSSLLAPLGLEPVVLIGRERGKERAQVLGELASGRARIVVGTHALFQDEVAFCDLALAVIDEQHRFGVQQRIDLLAKGRLGDVLVMTATPIPRTLVLSLYGDMAVSELRERPPGRQAVRTKVLPLARLDEVTGAIGRLLERGERLYWVCPLIETTEETDVATASERHDDLRARFGEAVGLVHGRMPARDKDRAMASFATGAIRILVATTVIEVGVDVPEAGVIVIEHAERFGLAQLHQLRGRVGRGTRAATCLLLYGAPLGATARARLDIMRRTDDGFRIAEADLKLRGPGELLGTKQSGLPAFRLTDLGAHADLLQPAHDHARLVLERDPRLESPRGRALRLLLRLFERHAAVAYLRSG